MIEGKSGIQRILSALALGAGLFLFLPTLIVIPMSFSSSRFWIFPFPGFSSRWYQSFFADRSWTDAFWLSLKVATVAAAIATAVGVPSTWALSRGRGKALKLLAPFLLSPLIIPLIVIAASCYFLFARLGWLGSWWALAGVHALLALPVVVVTIYLGLRSISPSSEWAARVLGADLPAVFGRIVLPQLKPSIALAYLLAFGVSLDEVVIASFLSGSRAITLPKRIFDNIRFDIDPRSAVAAVLLFAVSLAIFSLSGLIKAFRKTPQQE